MAIYWTCLITLNVPLFALVGRALFFKSADDFGESLSYLIRPDILSAFSGELHEDWWHSAKIYFFMLVCGLMVWGEHISFAGPMLIKGLKAIGWM